MIWNSERELESTYEHCLSEIIVMYKYECKAGIYESDTIIGLLWERFKHRLWHLRKQGRWID